MMRWCARCGKSLRAGVRDADPRHIWGPVGECRKCVELPDMEATTSQGSRNVRFRKINFCVICMRSFTPEPGATDSRGAICPHCDD